MEPFTEVEEQIIIGSLLGDGSLRMHSRNPIFREGHCLRQKEYLLWKGENLKSLSPSIHYYKKGYGKICPRLYTKLDPRLLPYYKEFYQPKKVLSLKYLYRLRALGLAVWYMDDGSKNGTSRSSIISTQCFTLQEHHLLKKYFEERWNISPTIHPMKRMSKKFFLRFPVKETKKLFDIIKIYIHPTMEYKIEIKPYIKNYNHEEVCYAF